LGAQINRGATQVKDELRSEGIEHPIFDKMITLIENNIDQTLHRFAEQKNMIG
jgi:hypothetical protein